MANPFFTGSRVRSHNAAGFTLTELMISMSIIGLMSVIVVMDLRASKRQEELSNGARIIAADLRSLQAQALTGQNIKTCTDAGGKNLVCERGASSCADPTTGCIPLPPYAVGAHFISSASSYDFFADVEQTRNDWMETPSANETTFVRDLARSGAPNVSITGLTAAAVVPEAHVAFGRQNGTTHISPCAAAPCAGAPTLSVTLTHAQSGQTKTVSMNATTGRISVY